MVAAVPPTTYAALLAVALLLAPAPASAGRPEGITAAEMALLPPYCPHTMGFKGHRQPHIGKWRAVMGEGFFHTHHYCWALVRLRRAERVATSPQHRQGWREESVSDLMYVIRNAGDDFILNPELFTWIGRTQIQLNKPVEANEAFARARALKPDYWPAYFHWAEFLQRSGRKAEALALAKAGLAQAPNAKSLQLLYRALGGRIEDLPPPPAPTPPAATNEGDPGDEASAPVTPAPEAQDKN